MRGSHSARLALRVLLPVPGISRHNLERTRDPRGEELRSPTWSLFKRSLGGTLQLRVAFISPFQLRLRRGIERSVRGLATSLAAAGQEVAIFSWQGKMPNDEIREENVRLYSMPRLRYFEPSCASLFYAGCMAHFRPDVVVVYFDGYGEARSLALTRPILRPAVVFDVGYPFNLVPHRFNEFKDLRLARSLSGIVVKADHMVDEVKEYFQKDVCVIPYGVDTRLFSSRVLGKSPTNPPSKHRLITVAAIEKRKGIDLVLSALPGVIDKVGPVHYTIVGDGPDRPWLESLVRESGLKSQVTLVGAVGDVRPYLMSSDVFLLPSYGEGLPNAFLEALAMGLPSIVSTAPPYDEVAHPNFAVAVDRHDPQALREAIIKLLLNADLRKSMGSRARKEAEKVYSWPMIAERYLDFLTKIARTGKRVE